jgi:ubiquitin-activating enzyme E1
VLENVVAMLEDAAHPTMAACVAWARLRFEEFFHNEIAQLLFLYPPDAKTPNRLTGASFCAPVNS